MITCRYALAVVFAWTAATAADFDVKSHYAKTEYQIGMRGLVKLYTAIYAPRGATGSLPILLTRTPYGSVPYGSNEYPKNLGPLGFPEEKFIFAFQDVRGRFMSEGEFVDVRPVKEALDGPQDTD
jgi:predicted acyl esterase